MMTQGTQNIDSSSDFSTLATRVYQTLRQEIARGVVAPGTRLVRRTISKRLGVSPIPVTEALFRLELDGLVESEPKYGSRVRPLTRETIVNDHMLREALEVQAARCCAEQATPAQLQELRHDAKVLDEQSIADTDDAIARRESHFELHMKIARFSGYPILEDELRRVWLRRLMVLNWLNIAAREMPHDWHQQLIQALSQRDPQVAENLMRVHVRHGQQHHMQMIENLHRTSLS